MLQSRDFKELLNVLEKHEVRYLVIGGYAVMLYSEPRWTKNLDLWIAIDAANANAIYFISREDLIAVKLASGRDQDLKDVEAIRKSI